MGNTMKHHNNIIFRPALTLDEVQQALAIRAACYMGELGFDAEFTFDGNDFQATHFLCFADGKPVGTMRARWFSDFVKLDRTSFLKAYRGPRVLKMGAEVIFEHMRLKGYTKVITHTNPKFTRVWKQVLGFDLVDKSALQMEGHEYAYDELIKNLEPHPEAINLDSSISRMFEIEGKWS